MLVPKNPTRNTCQPVQEAEQVRRQPARRTAGPPQEHQDQWNGVEVQHGPLAGRPTGQQRQRPGAQHGASLLLRRGVPGPLQRAQRAQRVLHLGALLDDLRARSQLTGIAPQRRGLVRLGRSGAVPGWQ